MIIDCPHCDAKVDGIEKGEHLLHYDHEPFPLKRVLLECPVCNSSLLGETELLQIGNEAFKWSGAVRLWPEPERVLSWQLPNIVSISLDEAKKCFTGKAYIGCAVMCGRAIEGICKDFETKDKNIAGGLKELLDRRIIDNRIYDWGEALRIHRNIGAHASEEKIDREVAADLLDFALAICDYIYILRDKFEQFMRRRNGAG